MKEIKHADLPNIPAIDIVNAINTGATIVNATYPFIKDLFGKVAELVASIQTDKLSTPKGKRIAIELLIKETEALKAQNLLQKELNKLSDNANILAYLKRCMETGALPTWPDITL